MIGAFLFGLGAGAQTMDDPAKDQATPGDILTYGMGYSNQRYSP